jgi:2-aminoadipate transaminase
MTISSKYLDALTPSAIRSITAQIRDKASQGVKIYSFAGGLPAPDMFPVKEMAEITVKAFKEEGGEAIQYAASDGYNPLRKEIVKLMKDKFNVNDITFKNILITSGSQQGLNYLSKGLIEPGDVVVCESPTYVGAIDSIKSYEPKIIGVKMDDDGINMNALEDILKHNKVKFIYVIPDFQNPSGRCLSIEKRKTIVELAETYDTFIYEDAPYSLISFTGKVLPAIKSFDKYNRVIYAGSFSKTIAPGIRVGWLVADVASIQKLIYMKMRDDLQVNNIAQRMVYGYLHNYDFDAHLEQVCKAYKERRDCMLQAVKEYFPSDTKVVVPNGGLFMWLELNPKIDTMKMFDFIFNKNIAYVPGTFFCVGEKGLNTMRLNFATLHTDVIKDKMAEFGKLIKEYTNNK